MEKLEPSTEIKTDPSEGNLNGTQEKGTKKKGSFRVVLLTFLLALTIRFYVAQPFIVNGESMEPSFRNGEYLIVDELTYRFRDPERKEVVVFRFPKDPSRFFIKRIIGLPEETVILTKEGVVIIDKQGNRHLLTEEYLPVLYIQDGEQETYTLKKNEYFVMGDNRNVSSDSRRWGAVPRELIVGRVIFRFLPIQEADLFPAQ